MLACSISGRAGVQIEQLRLDLDKIAKRLASSPSEKEEGARMMGGKRQQWLHRLRGLRRTQPTPSASQRSRRSPSRESLRASTFYQSPEAWRQLKLIAFEQGTSQQALLGEALHCS